MGKKTKEHNKRVKAYHQRMQNGLKNANKQVWERVQEYKQRTSGTTDNQDNINWNFNVN